MSTTSQPVSLPFSLTLYCFSTLYHTLFNFGISSKYYSIKSLDKSIATVKFDSGLWDAGQVTLKINGVSVGTTEIVVTLTDENKAVVATASLVVYVVAQPSEDDPDPEPDPEPEPTPKTPVITSSETSIQLKTGEERTVLISTNLASNEYNHINAANAKNGPVSTTWGKWQNDTSVPLTIKGVKAGADVVTVTLEGTNTVGEKVLATVKINVAVTENSDAPTTQIWASESSIKLAVNEKRTIVITENGNSYKFNKSCSDTSVVGAEWGEWLDSEQHSASLTLTGLKAGSAVMTVTARDENGNDLASTKINVTVTGSDPSTTGTKSNTITASSVTKNQSSKAQSFNLKASAKGGAKLSYKSNSSSVTVNSSGKVTIKKNFCGKAKITITAAAKGEYKKTTKKVTVTVKPGKPASLNLKTLKTTKVAFTWSKVPNATGYELWTVHKFGTQKFEVASTSFKRAAHGFKKNDSITVKVRAYKTVDGKRIYSPWTTKKGKLK